MRFVDIIADKVEDQSKVSQHEVDEDHVAVIDELALSEDLASREWAAKMRKLHPHLTHGAPE